MKKTIALIPVIFLFAACEQSYSPAKIADRATNASSCVEYETYFHDLVQSSVEETGSVASVDEVLKELNKNISTLSLGEKTNEKLSKSFKTYYSRVEEVVSKSGSKEDTLKALGQLEFGLHPNKALQKDYSEGLKEFKSLAAKSFTSCEKPSDAPGGADNNQSSVEPPVTPPTTVPDEQPTVPTPNLPFFEELKLKTANLSQYGALKSFSIAYQSCEAINIDALDLASENLKGVSVVGRHSSGRGNKREITNITQVRRTHHYIKNYRKPAANCVDSTINPLIYDFGGKPYASSSLNTLNFFKNAGSGSKELGVDCSGYIFAGLMSAGLKLAPNKPLRARNVFAIPARAYKNPGSSMSCIQKVKAGKGTLLKSGDIFASNGHIFFINIVGNDPLGVEAALKNKSCSSISYRDFDFTILQSSPSKSALGMNHMDAASYLKNSSSMRRGFEKFARLDCANKEKGRLSTPSISEASLVRHKMTADCVTEKVMELNNQSCVERCSYNG